MKALVYSPSRRESAYLDLVELDKPIVSPASCIVKVSGCGICGSDLLKLERSLVKAGTVLGHEMVGEIYDIDRILSEKYSFRKGDRIVSSHHVPCGKCKYCLNEKESLCEKFKKTNFKPGAFCEFLELSEDHLQHTVIKIEEHVSNLAASFTEPLACCIKAVKKSSLLNYKAEANVVVLGLGSIGILIGKYINQQRNEKKLNLYGIDPIAHKRNIASDSGFDEVHADLSNLRDSFKADFIFLAAGANACVDIALSKIADGGTIIVFSSVNDEAKAFSNNEIYYKELNIISSYSPNLNDLKESYRLISSGDISVTELISHRANLENLAETIMRAKAESGLKVYLDLENP